MKTTLVGINRILLAERRLTQAIRQTRLARERTAQRQKLLANIRQTTESKNLSLIIAIEKDILKYDLAHYANSPAMVASLQTAIDELQAVEQHLTLIADPATYRIVNQAHSLRKKRKAGLPFDDARQALASHHARLSNLDKSRLEEDEKRIVDARKAAMAAAQKLYIAQQYQTLGIAPPDKTDET